MGGVDSKLTAFNAQVDRTTALLQSNAEEKDIIQSLEAFTLFLIMDIKINMTITVGTPPFKPKNPIINMVSNPSLSWIFLPRSIFAQLRWSFIKY